MLIFGSSSGRAAGARAAWECLERAERAGRPLMLRKEASWRKREQNMAASTKRGWTWSHGEAVGGAGRKYLNIRGDCSSRIFYFF